VFTGIVQGSFPIQSVVDRPGLRTLTLALPPALREGLEVGASVAISGVCLTVTSLAGETVSFDAIDETQRRTTLGRLRVGDRVNVERSARAGAEVGGHELSGHVDGTAEIVAVDRPPGNHVVTFRAPRELIRYVFSKGFIALDGCSLTVVDVDRDAATFTVHLIPETLRVTTFDAKRAGDRVNLEIERRTQVIVDTVRDVAREVVRDVLAAELLRSSSSASHAVGAADGARRASDADALQPSMKR
jgi:riboflavin synthase